MLGDRKFFSQGSVFKWALTLALILIDAVWLSVSGYSVSGIRSVSIFCAISIGLITLKLVGQLARYRLVANHIYARRARLTLHCLFLLSVFAAAGGVLQYLVVTLTPPVVDPSLENLDQLLGFNWVRTFHWVRGNPSIHTVLQLAYASLLFQFVGIPWFLGLSGREQQLNEFVSCVMLSSFLLLLASAAFPAHSAFVYYGMGTQADLQTVNHFDLLRNGTMRVFDIDNIQGLVSIPSYHTALAIILTYVLRSNPPAFLLMFAINGLMVLSTPTEGGHYLVDVIAGFALAGVTIAVVRRLAYHIRPAKGKQRIQLAPGAQ